MCRGSAFVKFTNPEAAQACLKQVGDSRSGPPLEVKGRPCRVSLAVDRESAGNLKSDEKRHHDRRHIYLLEEGQIVPSSAGKRKSDELR